MRLVILDRDGVINHDSPSFVKSSDEWEPIPGSLEAIARLCRAGFHVVVFTNQSGLARGLFDQATLDAIHAKMRAAIQTAGGELAAIYFCPHGPDDSCECRKPRPGMLHQIGRDFGQSLAGVPVIGDSKRDLQAAQAVGARAILVRTGNGADTERAGNSLGAEVYDDLAAVADRLIGELGSAL